MRTHYNELMSAHPIHGRDRQECPYMRISLASIVDGSHIVSTLME